MISLLAGALLAQLGSAPLREGDSWSAELSSRYVNAREEIDLAFLERLDFRVDRASSFTAQLEMRRRLTETRTPDATVPADPKAGPLVVRITLPIRPPDAIRSDAKSGTDARRIDRLWAPLWPQALRPGLAEGQTWTVDQPADPSRGLGSLRHTFVVQRSPQGQDSRYGRLIPVSIEAVETGGKVPFTARGAALIQAESGLVVSMDLQAARMPIPGGADVADLTLSYRLLRLDRRR